MDEKELERARKLLKACEGIPDDVLDEMHEGGIRHFIFNLHYLKWLDRARRIIMERAGIQEPAIVLLPDEIRNPDEKYVWNLVKKNIKKSRDLMKNQPDPDKQDELLKKFENSIRMTNKANWS